MSPFEINTAERNNIAYSSGLDISFLLSLRIDIISFLNLVFFSPFVMNTEKTPISNIKVIKTCLFQSVFRVKPVDFENLSKLI